MKQYKFRGKRKDNGQWVFGSLIDKDYILAYIDLTESWMPLTSDHKLTCRAYEIVPESVGMWTGLRDTNNIEIYSDDKLRAFQKEQGKTEGFEITDYVYHQNGGFKVFGKCMQDGYTKDNGMLYQFMWCQPGSLVGRDTYWQLDNIEIIGNRFDDHPQLLNPAAGISGTHHMQDPREQGQPEEGQTTETQPEVLPDSEEGNTEG